MKIILLIGGSYGIGLQLAKNLQENYEVHVASRTNEKLQDLNVTHHSFDANDEAIEDLSLPDKIDGLVFCPGTINLKPFKMLSAESFEEDLQKNFINLVKIVKGFLPKLKNAEQASLVFFSTVAVQTGMPFHTSVAASKGAIEGFAKSLAAEYAPSMRVNVIAPSLTDTPLASKILNNDKKKNTLSERHPLKRVGSANDIAQMALFLLSDNSSWITGQVFGVDGGLSTLNIN